MGPQTRPRSRLKLAETPRHSRMTSGHQKSMKINENQWKSSKNNERPWKSNGNQMKNGTEAFGHAKPENASLRVERSLHEEMQGKVHADSAAPATCVCLLSPCICHDRSPTEVAPNRCDACDKPGCWRTHPECTFFTRALEQHVDALPGDTFLTCVSWIGGG